MKRPIQCGQHDLFAAYDIVPLSLPKVAQVELARLISAVLVEIVTYQRSMPQSASQGGSHGHEDYS